MRGCCNFEVKKLRAFVEWKVFECIILVVIILNSIVLGTDHYGQPQWLSAIQTYSNYVFIGFFTLELLLRILAVGLCEYISDTLHLLDAAIVVVSIIELFFP